MDTDDQKITELLNGDDSNQDPYQLVRQLRGALKDQSRTLRSTKAELEQVRSGQSATQDLEREVLALRQGIDLSSPLGEIFRRGYTGEWTPEAVRDAWDKLGVVTGQSPAAEQDESQPSIEQLVNARAEFLVERQRAIEGQRTLGAAQFGEQPPPSWGDPKARLIGDMAEAVDRVRVTGARDSGPYVEAIREVMHKNGRVLADELD